MLDNSVTIKEATVDKAIKLGLAKLNATREEVDVNIISEGKKGLFGFGKQDAIVELTLKKSVSLSELLEDVAPSNAEPTKPQPTPPVETPQPTPTVTKEEPVKEVVVTTEPKKEAPTQELAPEIKADSPVAPARQQVEVAEDSTPIRDEAELRHVADYLENVIREYGADAQISFTTKGRQITFEIETSKTGMIIGKHGKIIDALQTLAQVLVHRSKKRRATIMINVGDYRDRRAETLERIAKRTAREVLATKQSVVLEPLPSYERKQIHSYLSKVDHIQTHSEGEEPNRYLVVEYVN